MIQRVIAAALAGVLCAGAALAQNAAESGQVILGLDLTMRLMPADAVVPDAVVATIELPRAEDGSFIPHDKAVERSGRGLTTANAARENGRAFGEAMAAAARENREDVTRGGRADATPSPPDQAADRPLVPERPVPQERPEPATPPRP
jgi:hypothetical protein